MIPAIAGMLLAQHSILRSSYESSPSTQEVKKNPKSFKRKAMFVDVNVVQRNGTARPETVNASYILRMEASDMQPVEWSQELKRWKDIGNRMKVTNVFLWDGSSYAILESPTYVKNNSK